MHVIVINKSFVAQQEQCMVNVKIKKSERSCTSFKSLPRSSVKNFKYSQPPEIEGLYLKIRGN